MSVIETRYNSIDLPADHEMSISYQLDERCKRLLKTVSLAFFVKIFGMDEQYKAVKRNKFVRITNDYDF